MFIATPYSFTVGQVSAEIPDDVLLEIFSFYVEAEAGDVNADDMNGWHTLVHVCQSWRHVVFASPRRLNLRLLCTNRRPVKEMLDIWPMNLPIIIRYNSSPLFPAKGADNIIAALEHRDRVCEIALWGVSSSLSERFAAMTREPFPALTSLLLGSNNEWAPTIPDSFLAGSAPRLRRLWLVNTPFPALRKLLMSTSDLVHLDLLNIPYSAYISPETMVTCLSGMPGIQTLNFKFLSSRSRPDPMRQRPPVLTRTVLPALTLLGFQGASEYLEDFVAQINTPLLTTLSVTFLGLVFHIPQLCQFIGCAEKLKPSNRATVGFYVAIVCFKFVPSSGFELAIKCDNCPGQVSSMAVVCRELSPLLTRVERLELLGRPALRPVWQDITDPMEWQELFYPFIAVQSLHVSKKLGPLIAPALQALTGERVTEVLPRLLYIFYEGFRPSGPVHEATKPFVTARQQSSLPVAVLRWVRELDMYSEFGDWDVDD